MSVKYSACARYQSTDFFFNFGGHESFLWGHWYPCFGLLVTSPLGFKVRVSSLICPWQRHMCYTFPEIHLWCDTCWPLGSQHGSLSISSTYLWDIGGTRNWELSCHHSLCEIRQARRSTDWAIPARPKGQTLFHYFSIFTRQPGIFHTWKCNFPYFTPKKHILSV